MADALSKFISGLQTLDPSNLSAPANAAALQKFQSLDNGSQRDVLNGLARSVGATFEELDALSNSDKQRLTQNVKDGRNPFDGVTRAQQTQQTQQATQPDAQPEARTFEQKWVQAKERETSDPTNLKAFQESHEGFAKQHGEEAARTRHGYVSPERQKQLERQAAIRSEAKRTGQEFGDVAEQWGRDGK